ncbi:MAG: surface carbohydrate biosynthesis protein [Thermodesulfobacteriota bacterium]
MNKYLYLPIETKVRELEAKLLLACHAAAAGFSVLLGEQHELWFRMHGQPPGVYISTGATDIHLDGIVSMKKLGHRVAAWCEEGLAILDRQDYARHRISKRAMRELDLFFAWGAYQAEAARWRVPEAAGKIVLAGNPRLDILRPPYRSAFLPRAEELREKYGPYILVNSSFGVCNNIFGPDFVLEKMIQSRGRIEDEAHKKFFHDWIEHLRGAFAEFQALVDLLARRFPDHRVLVRPHPSENQAAWREAATRPNVEVIHQGNVAPWILGAQAVVHHACTTGVESFLLGKTPISYRPQDSDVFEPALPKAASISTFTPEEVVRQVQRRIEAAGTDGSDQEGEAIKARMAEFIFKLDGPYSSEIIVAALERLLEDGDGWAGSKTGLAGRLFYWRMFLRRQAVQQLVFLKNISRKKLKDYSRQKFPGVTLPEVVEIVNGFQKVNDRFRSLRIQRDQGARACFRIAAGT